MRSIRSKFIIFIFAILSVLLLLLNTYPIITSRDAVFEEKRNSLAGQVSVVSSALGGLDRLSPDGVRDVLHFLELENYSRIVVIDDNGGLIYDDGIGEPELADLQQALLGKEIFRSIFTNRCFSSSVVAPIGTQGGILGAVALYENDTERADIILEIQHQVRILSIAISIVALILALVFSWIVLRRLEYLTNSMQIVASGDYSWRHTVTGNDELSELGKEFNALTERLETNEEQRRRFVSDASHELKTPIASIRLLSDSILQTADMEENMMREFVSDIRSESERLQRTTEKLLDLSRLDDSIQVIPEPVDLKQITLDAIPGLLPLSREKDIQLDTDLEDGCVIMANAEDMSHVVFNLTENAIKYNVPGGKVMIRLSQDSETVRLSVEDTGIGIPEEDRYNVFTRFYRVDKARSRASGGSGLGLSIVHDAVLAHGGMIQVGGNHPCGTVFVVSFPRPSSEETGI